MSDRDIKPENVRRPSADTDPRDICPDCRNGVVMFAMYDRGSACSDPECVSANGHNPALREWRWKEFK